MGVSQRHNQVGEGLVPDQTHGEAAASEASRTALRTCISPRKLQPSGTGIGQVCHGWRQRC